MTLILDLEALDRMSDPRNGMVASRERVPLTDNHSEKVVYAVGRRNGLTVIDIEEDGKFFPHLLASLASHSPGLYNRLDTSKLTTPTVPGDGNDAVIK